MFGRTSSGTLKLSVDERGLVSEIKMPNTQAAKGYYCSYGKRRYIKDEFWILCR